MFALTTAVEVPAEITAVPDATPGWSLSKGFVEVTGPITGSGTYVEYFDADGAPTFDLFIDFNGPGDLSFHTAAPTVPALLERVAHHIKFLAARDRRWMDEPVDVVRVD